MEPSGGKGLIGTIRFPIYPFGRHSDSLSLF
jgi:hypothetical protein